MAIDRQFKKGDRLGRYRLLDELGRGGMAVVFRAEDPSLGREVALKVMHLHLWGKAEHAARFIREARAVAALRHPNIVEIFDFSEGSEEEGTPGYIVSELIHGSNLRDFILEHGRPLPEVAAMIGIKLAAALSAAHGAGIIHRDLKPENVMIAQGGRVLLTDFGIARIKEGDTVTQTGAMVGSPAYMSPEQARGEGVDPRSDLFALGTLLYQLGTGQLPFKGSDPLSTVLKVLDGSYEPPLKVNPALGTRLGRVITKLLKHDPGRRYSDADSVGDELRAVVRDGSVTDVDLELVSYFDNPPGYCTTLVGRVIDSSLDLAREAHQSGEIPRALALCDRVLALDGGQADALALMEELSAQAGISRRIMLGSGAVLLAAGLAAGVAVWFGQDRPQVPVASAPDSGSALPPPDARLEPDHAAPDAPGPDRATPDDQRSDRSQVDSKRRRPRPPRPRPPTRTADAAPPPSPDLSRPKPDLPGHAELEILIGPWCKAAVDGKEVGISPMQGKVLRLPPGSHRVTCRYQGGGSYDRTLVLVRGRRTVLHSPLVQVRLDLHQGDAVRINGRIHRAGMKLEPKRYRVELLRSGAVLKAAYLTVPSQGCTIMDSPRLSCR